MAVVDRLQSHARASPRRVTAAISAVGYALVFGTFGGVLPFPTISNETASTAESAADAAAEQRTATGEAADTAGSLADHADQLQQLIRRFDVSDAAGSTTASSAQATALGDGGQPN